MKQWLKPQTVISLILAISALLTALSQYTEKRKAVKQLEHVEGIAERQGDAISRMLE